MNRVTNPGYGGGLRVRFSVAFSGLTHRSEQLDLLDPQRKTKLEKLSQAADALRDRFGFAKIQFGGSLLTEKPERENEKGEIPRFPRHKE